jgi:branched-chain amino acid transport system substrate-binding protein
VALNGIQLAVDEVNEAGGVLGKQIEIIAEDGKCNGTDALTAYTKLVDVDEVSIILGPSCSGEMLGFASRVDDDEVVVFSGLTSNPAISTAGDYIFRNVFSDADVGKRLAEVIISEDFREVGLIGEATDYIEGVRTEFANNYETLGGAILSAERYTSEETDFSAALTRVLADDPPALVVLAQSEFAYGTLYKQARELGYEGQMFSVEPGLASKVLEIAGDAAEGVIGVLVPQDIEYNPAGAELTQKYVDKHGSISLHYYIGSSYDSVHIIAGCIEDVGSATDTSGIRDCLYGVNRDNQYTGAIGTYGFDSNGDMDPSVFVVYQLIDGESVIQQ